MQVGDDAIAIAKDAVDGSVVFLVRVRNQEVTWLDVERNPKPWKAQSPTGKRAESRKAGKRTRHVVPVLVREERNVLVQRDGAEGVGAGEQVAPRRVPLLQHLPLKVVLHLVQGLQAFPLRPCQPLRLRPVELPILRKLVRKRPLKVPQKRQQPKGRNEVVAVSSAEDVFTLWGKTLHPAKQQVAAEVLINSSPTAMTRWNETHGAQTAQRCVVTQLCDGLFVFCLEEQSLQLALAEDFGAGGDRPAVGRGERLEAQGLQLLLGQDGGEAQGLHYIPPATAFAASC